MSFVSKSQSRWAHTPEGTKALGGAAKVKEWEGATDYKHLPQKLAKGGVVKEESKAHEATESPAFEAKEEALVKGKRPHHQNMEMPPKPSLGGSNDGHGIFFAQGGPVRNSENDKHYKRDTRGGDGKFLGTPDRFTGGRKPAGYPQEAETEENWVKPAGVGHTDKDDCGDCKVLKPILPRG